MSHRSWNVTAQDASRSNTCHQFSPRPQLKSDETIQTGPTEGFHALQGPNVYMTIETLEPTYKEIRVGTSGTRIRAACFEIDCAWYPVKVMAGTHTFALYIPAEVLTALNLPPGTRQCTHCTWVVLPGRRYKDDLAATVELDESQVKSCPAAALPAGASAADIKRAIQEGLAAAAAAQPPPAALAADIKCAIREGFADAHAEELHLVHLAYALSKRPQSSISLLGGERACVYCAATADVHGCHIAALKYFDPGSDCHRREFRVLLGDWHNNRYRTWRRSFLLNHPMNLVRMCKDHHGAFDSNRILLIFAPFPRATFVLVEPDSGREVTLPEVYTKVLSHRAVMFRLQRVMEAGIVLPPTCGSLESLRDRSRGQSDASGAASDDIGLPASVS